MLKEYMLFYCRIVDGQPFGHIVATSFLFSEIERIYRKKTKRKNHKEKDGYSYEIMERTIGEWQNIDYENVMGFDLSQ